MCAGFAIYYEKLKKAQVKKCFTDTELEKFKKGDELEFYFWQKKPCVPIEENGKVNLYEWGNRNNKELKMPKTGWCRAESLASGKWDWLKPKIVHVPATRGFEKKKWFRTPKGIEAVLARQGKEKKVYILTEPSSGFYSKLTGHDRMPVGDIKEIIE
ncbi:MAG: hypothetical protein ACOZBH_02840 [Patescibacteria group bacterium]